MRAFFAISCLVTTKSHKKFENVILFCIAFASKCIGTLVRPAVLNRVYNLKQYTTSVNIFK